MTPSLGQAPCRPQRRAAQSSVGGATLLVGGVLLACGCRAPLPLSGELSRVEALAARHHGAAERACAPVELATADAQLRFARLELGRGNTSRARGHLALAELNTRAARILTREACAPASDDVLRIDPLRSDAMQHRAPSHASRPSITTLGRLRQPGALGVHAARAAENQPAPPRPGA